jgi:hypothetical protein
VFRLLGVCCVVVTGGGLVGVASVAPPAPDIQIRAVHLTGVDTADSSLGDGVAFINFAATQPIPLKFYVDATDKLFLEPRGFTGTTEPVVSPESFFPLNGVQNVPIATSFLQGALTNANDVEGQIATGHVDAANPAVVFGWSEGAIITADSMRQLHDAGVPSDDVHFVQIGDLSTPNGGILERFAFPGNISAGPQQIQFGFDTGAPQQGDLYPADVYNLEYDGFADFPKYPLDFLSDLNAFVGMLLVHTAYEGLTPEQIADAIQLPTSAADTLTNYYEVPIDALPLLAPLRLIPVIGQPLYDLLEPDMRILVNLGYGSITDGWSQGDANVTTTVGVVPPSSVLEQVPDALAKGLQQGITDFIKDLQNPDDLQPLYGLEHSPILNTLVNELHNFGLVDATNVSQLLAHPPPLDPLIEVVNTDLTNMGIPLPATFGIESATSATPSEIVNDLSSLFTYTYTNLLAIPDTLTTLHTSLPAADLTIFTDGLHDGSLLDAIGDPLATNTALVPTSDLLFEAVPLLLTAGVDLLNVAELTGQLPDTLADINA